MDNMTAAGAVELDAEPALGSSRDVEPGAGAEAEEEARRRTPEEDEEGREDDGKKPARRRKQPGSGRRTRVVTVEEGRLLRSDMGPRQVGRAPKQMHRVWPRREL